MRADLLLPPKPDNGSPVKRTRRRTARGAPARHTGILLFQIKHRVVMRDLALHNRRLGKIFQSSAGLPFAFFCPLLFY